MPAFDTPLSTVWPAGVAAAILVLALWLSRRHFSLPRGWVAVASAAVFIRMVVIPVFEQHTFDGHEADYFDLFRGLKEPTRGGTVMVPAVQWFWWLIGRPLSHAPADAMLLRVVPVVLMCLVSLVALGALAGAVGLLAGRRAGWFAAAFLVVNPAHSVWATSAYNVILPHAMGCLALLAVARIATRSGAPGALGWVAAGAGALSVAMRMDTAAVGLPIVGLALLIRPASVGAWQRLKSLLLPGVAGLVLTALAVWPLVWPGELPGAGERALSFQVNLGLLEYYSPMNEWMGLSLLGVLLVLVIRAHPKASLVLLPLALVQHLIMASFDDFGVRHTLPTLIPLAWLVGAGAAAAPRLGWLLWLLVLVLNLRSTQDLADRFYGSEATFRAVLDQPPYADLPRVRWPQDVRTDCGWVVEDHRVRREVVKSHFNLIKPAEEAALRGPDGCLLWCLDVQDWRWSSRSVRDRALRLQHLFELEPAFVVEDSDTGYACLAMQVGSRRVNSTTEVDGSHSPTYRRHTQIP